MTHLFGCHDNELSSTEHCSEQPCCSKKIVIALHCIDLYEMMRGELK